jgi:hypothetical protein
MKEPSSQPPHPAEQPPAQPSARSIPWARLGAESLTIVASILLAFAIDAWWDGRQAAAREADVLRALAVEVAANQVDLWSDVQDNEAALSLIDRFLRSDPDDLAGLSADSVASWTGAMFGYRTFEPRSRCRRCPLYPTTAVQLGSEPSSGSTASWTRRRRPGRILSKHTNSWGCPSGTCPKPALT